MNGLTIDLEGAVARDFVGDVGVPASAELLGFANAVQLGDRDIDTARHALAAVIGDEAMVEAAAIVAIFNGLVRVADGTGIELDGGVFAASVELRESLGLDSFAGAANSARVPTHGSSTGSVSELFG